jgi:hypothetical protein
MRSPQKSVHPLLPKPVLELVADPLPVVSDMPLVFVPAEVPVPLVPVAVAFPVVLVPVPPLWLPPPVEVPVMEVLAVRESVPLTELPPEPSVPPRSIPKPGLSRVQDPSDATVMPSVASRAVGARR